MIKTRWYWLGLVGSSILLAVAYFYFQQKLELPPCPLCMFQRVCLVGVMFFCVLGIIFRPKKWMGKVFSFGVLLSTVSGLAIAGRQVWLQHLPDDQVPECGADLPFLMDSLPLIDVIQTVLSGSGECAEVQWDFLGFSMAEWMVAVFTVMTLIAIKLLFTKQRKYFSGTYRS